MQGLLVSLMDHKSLSSSQCDGVVMELNNLYDNNFIMLRCVFVDFNEVADRLYNFWFEKAKISHFKISAFYAKLFLTLHVLVSVELDFSIGNIVHNTNMKEGTIMAKDIVDHMNSYKLKPHAKEINCLRQ